MIEQDLISRAWSELRARDYLCPAINSAITEIVKSAAIPVIFRSCMCGRSFDARDVLADAPELTGPIDVSEFVNQVLRQGLGGCDGLGLFEDGSGFAACFENFLIAQDAAHKTGYYHAILRHLNVTEQDICRCLLSLPVLNPENAHLQKDLRSALIF